MNFLEELDRVRLHLSGRAWFILAYRVSPAGNADPPLEFYWGTSTFGEKGSELAPRYYAIALECYKVARNGIILPKSSSRKSAAAPRWWGFVIATGPTRNAGIVLVGMLLANDAAELEAHLAEVQAIMGANKEQHILRSEPSLSFPGDLINLSEPPTTSPGMGDTTAEWVSMGEKTDVNVSNGRFERLNEFLWKLPFAHCVVYNSAQDDAQLKLEPLMAISPYINSKEKLGQLAENYREIASYSYRHRRDMVVKENLPSIDSRGERWFGLVAPPDGVENAPPANSVGQRWWHLVVGAGATRDAGYVIVARVAATDASQVQDCIAEIQKIMSIEQ